MSGGGSTSTVVKPWKQAEPYMKDIMGQAQDLFNSDAGRNYYDFSTAVTPSNPTQASWDMVRNAATNNPAYMGAAGDLLTNTLQGNYLNNNPYLDQIVAKGSGHIADQVNSAFGAAGRTGSGYHQQNLTDSIGNYAAQVYGGAYNDERNRMQQGMMMAPALDASRYTGAQMMGQVGGQQEGFAQQQIADAMGRQDFYNQQPYNLLNQYSGIIGSMGGFGNSTSASGGGISPVAGALGGAATGAGIASLLGGGAAAGGAGAAGGAAAAGTAAAAANPFMWPLLIGGGILGAFA